MLLFSIYVQLGRFSLTFYSVDPTGSENRSIQSEGKPLPDSSHSNICLYWKTSLLFLFPLQFRVLYILSPSVTDSVRVKLPNGDTDANNNPIMILKLVIDGSFFFCISHDGFPPVHTVEMDKEILPAVRINWSVLQSIGCSTDQIKNVKHCCLREAEH